MNGQFVSPAHSPFLQIAQFISVVDCSVRKFVSENICVVGEEKKSGKTRAIVAQQFVIPKKSSKRNENFSNFSTKMRN